MTRFFLHEVEAPEAFFDAVTPRRGTPMREQLEAEDRVIVPDADMYTNNFRCMFVPRISHLSRSRKVSGAAPRSFIHSNRCSSGC